MTAASQTDTADVVIAGGGTAGSVIAARLAAARPDWQIVLIEAGPDTRDTPEADIPLLGLGQVFTNPDVVTTHQSPPSSHLDGRETQTPIARVLGGGTVINQMAFNTPAASDFETWPAGWSFEELLPYFRKVTTSHVDNPKGVYGTDGPIHLSYGQYSTELRDEFFRVMQDAGYPFEAQVLDHKTGRGYGPNPKYIAPDGKRSHAASGYLGSKTEGRYSNVHILEKTTVDTIVFDDGKAVGVAICDPQNPSCRIIRAQRQVVLCGGAFGDPAILQRSGVGPAHVLEQLGIPVVVDSPGVGAQYLDHSLLLAGYHVPDSVDTFDPLLTQDAERSAQAMKQYQATQDGPLSDNINGGVLRIHPTEQELVELGPAFSKHWTDIGGPSRPDKALLTVLGVQCFAGDRTDVPASGRYMGPGWFLNYPASHGRLQIASRDPHGPLDFDDRLCSEPCDIDANVWAYKTTRHLYRQFRQYRGEIIARHPQFPPGSAARAQTYTHQLAADEAARPLVYSDADDEAIRTWVRKEVSTAWHSMGTCPMKPRQQGGVVGPRLDVYGVTGLKIADMSIVPGDIGANTALTALMIGEKAADLILEDLSG